MTIRAALPDEASVLSRVAYAAKAHWGYDEETLARWSPDLTITPSYVNDHAVFVAEIDDTVVGVCALEEYGTHRKLGHLWVLPEAQGRGVGSRLLRHVRQMIAGRPGPLIVESDPHAAKFYARHGGRPSGHLAAPIPGDDTRTLPLFEFDVT